jgi:hypothetical protein
LSAIRPRHVADTIEISLEPAPRTAMRSCICAGVSRHHLQNRLSFSESSSRRRLLPSIVVRSTASAKHAAATGCARTLSRALCSGSGALVANPVCSASTTRSMTGTALRISAARNSFPSMKITGTPGT